MVIIIGGVEFSCALFDIVSLLVRRGVIHIDEIEVFLLVSSVGGSLVIFLIYGLFFLLLLQRRLPHPCRIHQVGAEKNLRRFVELLATASWKEVVFPRPRRTNLRCLILS